MWRQLHAKTSPLLCRVCVCVRANVDTFIALRTREYGASKSITPQKEPTKSSSQQRQTHEHKCWTLYHRMRVARWRCAVARRRRQQHKLPTSHHIASSSHYAFVYILLSAGPTSIQRITTGIVCRHMLANRSPITHATNLCLWLCVAWCRIKHAHNHNMYWPNSKTVRLWSSLAQRKVLV